MPKEEECTKICQKNANKGPRPVIKNLERREGHPRTQLLK